MNNLNELPSCWEKERLVKNGLRLGDQIKISPLSGRKKKMVINRTSIDFCSEEVFEQYPSAFKVSLPAMCDERFIFRLSLLEEGKGQKRGRFELTSKSNRPFMLNGVLCYRAFIERGDQVRLGHNLCQFGESFDEENKKEEFEKTLSTKLLESDHPILLEGETGSGKSRMAKLIHERSGRVGRFIHLNISSFSSGLLESELFGHVKGAFTGAVGNKSGAIREADGGTLFLDEIDSLSLDIQTKLLLFLDNKEYRNVGGHGTLKSHTRIIFAAGRSIRDCMEKQLFRNDFGFRVLSSVKYKLPNLKNHPELIANFCERFCLEHQVSMSLELLKYYQELPWPGNYRQLKSHLEMKLIQTQNKKLIYDKTDEELKFFQSNLDFSLKNENLLSMNQMKALYAQRVLQLNGGSYSHASELLKISHQTLRNLVSTVA